MSLAFLHVCFVLFLCLGWFEMVGWVFVLRYGVHHVHVHLVHSSILQSWTRVRPFVVVFNRS